MILEKINNLLADKFKEESFIDCFLVESKLNVKTNTLRVFIDADSGLKITQCQQISRYLEKFIDEEQWLGEKYTLEVSSPGLDQPLKLERQFQKNIGRRLIVHTKTGEVHKGTLKELADELLHLEELIIKKEGKKKVKQLQTVAIPLNNIDKAKVQIVFK